MAMFDRQVQLPKSTKWLKISTVSLAIFTVCLGGFLVYGVYFQKNQSETRKEDNASTEPLFSEQSGRIEDKDVTWQEPQRLEDLELFKEINENSVYDATAYYKVGTVESRNDIVLAVVNFKSSENPDIHRFVGKDGKYQRLIKNSDNVDDEIYSITDKVKSDESSVFKSLLADPVITNGSTRLLSSMEYEFYIESIEDVAKKKVSDTKWGGMYLEFSRDISIKSINQEIDDEETIIKIARYYILLNDSTQLSYEPNPDFLLDDGTFDLDYSLEEASGQSFQKTATPGCSWGFGSFGYLEYPVTDESRVEIGRTQDKVIYTVRSVNHKLMKYVYELYKSDGARDKVPMIEFAASIPFAYWTDIYGDSILYINSKFQPASKCGGTI